MPSVGPLDERLVTISNGKTFLVQQFYDGTKQIFEAHNPDVDEAARLFDAGEGEPT